MTCFSFSSSFFYFMFPSSTAFFFQPAGPRYAGWSSYDNQQTQSASKHSLSSSTHSNCQAYRQALLLTGRFHLPGITQGESFTSSNHIKKIHLVNTLCIFLFLFKSIYMQCSNMSLHIIKKCAKVFIFIFKNNNNALGLS